MRLRDSPVDELRLCALNVNSPNPSRAQRIVNWLLATKSNTGLLSLGLRDVTVPDLVEPTPTPVTLTLLTGTNASTLVALRRRMLVPLAT